MDRKKLFKLLTYLIFLILIVNFFANKFYWYYTIWYFDMPMHFAGGFWLGLAIIYLFPLKDVSSRSIFIILSPVLLVGIGWEFYEVLANNLIAQNPFNALDTISDVFFDLTGASSAALYVFNKIMFGHENTV